MILFAREMVILQPYLKTIWCEKQTKHFGQWLYLVTFLLNIRRTEYVLDGVWQFSQSSFGCQTLLMIMLSNSTRSILTWNSVSPASYLMDMKMNWKNICRYQGSRRHTSL
jgi:hypothetical protein